MVLGAGPAGAATARAAARSGLSVLLAGARPAEGFRVGESLVPAARNLLEALDVWAAFEAEGHRPCYGNLSAWGGPDLAETDFIRSPWGPGWHLDRSRFDAMLVGQAEAAGAELWPTTRLKAAERRGASWELVFEAPGGPRIVRASWLVEATGRSRRLAGELGVQALTDDRLLAFWLLFRPADPVRDGGDQESRTLVEAAPEGWFHTALLPSGERIATLFTDAGSAWAAGARTRDGFLALLRETRHIAALCERHGYLPAGEPRATDARSSRLARFSGEGWLAVGDAATAFDPLSSQGLYFALYSGLKAGEALAGARAGDGEAAARYGARVEAVWEAFLTGRRESYRAEGRWPESPFWGRRR